jgi:phenylacetic acid degradation operon negative regulatory protein
VTASSPAVQPPSRQSRSTVVTFLGAVVRPLGSWMPIAGTVDLLTQAGLDAPSVRTAVHRLKGNGWLQSEAREGARGYALTTTAIETLAAGDEVIWHARTPADVADGWCIVHFGVPESMRAKRHQLRAHLSSLGFGNVGTALWIAPARMRTAAERAVTELGLEAHTAVFVGEYHGTQDLTGLLYGSWDLTAIDDGYRDFVTAAHPVFHAYDIPTTIFVVSDFLDGARWLPHDVVRYALAHTARKAPAVDVSAFNERLKGRPHAERDAAIAALVRELEVDIPSRPPEEYAPMTWDDARGIVREGVEIGVHTKTHAILSQVTDAARLLEEILTPRARIEAELGRPALHFCYPNGRSQDFTAATIDLLKTSGFATAVTTERGINFADAAPFQLRRLGVEPNNPMPYFAELLAGVRAQ